jgi:hypothetical protein
VRQVLYAVLGASLTAASSLSAGLLLFRIGRVALPRREHLTLAYLAGSAMLSTLIFAIAMAHLVYKGVLVALGVALILAAWRWGARPTEASPVRISRWLLALAAPFAVLYLLHALAPEHSPDGVTYHLGLIARYYREHGFNPIHTTMYAQLTQGAEMLYLMAYAVGRHSAASLVHLTFLFALALAMFDYAARKRLGWASSFALAPFVSPVFGIDGTSAYNDVALAATLFGMFAALDRDEAQPGTFVMGGLLAGFGFAIKYTGGLGLVAALALVRRKGWRPTALVVAGFSAIAAPWLAKNIAFTGNPVSPFANAWFPNPVYSLELEDSYKRDMRESPGVSFSQAPLEATTRGSKLGGLVGPMFLLTPVALLAIRRAEARKLLLVGLLLAVPFALNVGTRFLMPAVPFFALAIGITMPSMRAAQALMTLHAVLSWPGLVPLYADPTAWRLEGFPLRAALRIESEDAFLDRVSFPYVQARMVEQHVPEGDPVFSFGTMAADAYTSRELIVGFQSKFGARIRDLLITPILFEQQPTRLLEFSLNQTDVRAVRLIQTSSSPDVWSVSELRLFAAGTELVRESVWRIAASANGRDVGLAFDNSPVTRWRAERASRPGQWIEVCLPSPQAVDRVRVDSSRDQYQVRLKLEWRDASGLWHRVDREPEDIEVPPPPASAMRRAASEEVQALGIRWLLVDEHDYVAPDFKARAADWGLRLIAERGAAKLYRLE